LFPLTGMFPCLRGCRSEQPSRPGLADSPPSTHQGWNWWGWGTLRVQNLFFWQELALGGCCEVNSVQTSTSIRNHRITEWFGVEGTFEGHLVYPPATSRDVFTQVAQSPVQPGLECSQGWGISRLTGQPLPVLRHPHCKRFLP